MSNAEHVEPPFEAYSGEAPFIFVSYSHKDGALVYPEIERLHKLGYRIWYDEGIDPGNEWPDEVARALDCSSFFLVFISARAVESKNVKNEINFAINHQKPFVAVHIETTDLPKGLELRMGDIQAIFKYRMSFDRYCRQMEKALPLTLQIQVSAEAARQAQAREEAAKAVVDARLEAQERERLNRAQQELERRLEEKRLLEEEKKRLQVALTALNVQPKAGVVRTVDMGRGVALELVWCPPGSFQMGSPASEIGRLDQEVRHRVKLTKGFWIGKVPVTQGQWESLTGSNPSCFKAAGKDAPVEQVSWDDCQGFLEKLQPAVARAMPNTVVRLPTEAEWEYACRAGTETALNNGKDLTSENGVYANLDVVGWYIENSGGTTHAVGQKASNAWGIFDMHGNVWEWCADWCGGYPGGEVTDPTGPAAGSSRVLRGGSWLCEAKFCRSAFIFGFDPDRRYNFLGFRLVVR